MDDRKQRLEQIEINKVNKDPDNVGINIDQDYIVDGIYAKGLEAVKAEWFVRYGSESVTAEGELDRRVFEQKAKVDKLRNFLSQFPRLEHVRINPYGVESPITPTQAIQISPDGTRRVNINPDFQEQLKMIVEKSADPTLMVQFYNSKNGAEHCSDVPTTDQEIADYTAICDTLLTQHGDKLQLEIGNETNVTRLTGKMFTSLQFATHTDAHEYAQFYIKVASELKRRHPHSKLSMAGIACYDPEYLTTVLSDVKAYETQTGSEKLIDTVSFHPYRQEPEQGAVEINKGKFGNRPMTYEQQIDEFLGIVRNYNADVIATVGEIGFPPQDPQHRQKLERSIEITKQKGVTSHIYPAVNL